MIWSDGVGITRIGREKTIKIIHSGNGIICNLKISLSIAYAVS